MYYLIFLLLIFVSCPGNTPEKDVSSSKDDSEKNNNSSEEDAPSKNDSKKDDNSPEESLPPSQNDNEKNDNSPEKALPQKKGNISPFLFNYNANKERIDIEKESISIKLGEENAVTVSLNPQHDIYKKIYKTLDANDKDLEKGEFIPFWKVLILKEGVKEKLENEGLKSLESQDIRDISNSNKIFITVVADDLKDFFKKSLAFAPGTFLLLNKGERLFLNLAIYKKSDTAKDKDVYKALAGKEPVYNFLIQIKKVKN